MNLKKMIKKNMKIKIKIKIKKEEIINLIKKVKNKNKMY